MPPKPRKNVPTSETAFSSVSELRAMMERALREEDEHWTLDFEAQQLAYDAMDAIESPERHLELLRASLSFDPENVDSLLMMLRASRIAGSRRIHALQIIVQTGARKLGSKTFAPT